MIKEIDGVGGLEIEMDDDVIWLHDYGDGSHPGHVAFWRKDISLLIKELRGLQLENETDFCTCDARTRRKYGYVDVQVCNKCGKELP